MKTSLTICAFLCYLTVTFGQDNKVVCYWNSLSSRNENLKGYFQVADIDPTICTHIIYTYIRFTAGVVIFQDYEPDVVQQFINLRSRNTNVKLLIGVGGPRQGTQIPSKISLTATDRKTFSDRVSGFIEQYGFDGCDIDWQWPGQGTGSSPDDKANYVKLLNDLKNAMGVNKILSVSVAPRNEDIEQSYDIENISKIVDIINLNTFNFRGLEGETVTGFHSPYRKNPNDRTLESEWNAESVVINWLEKGCPAAKMTLGIPTYGKSFTLSNSAQSGVGASVSGLGRKSEYLVENSNIIPYMEICHNVNFNDKWRDIFDETQFAPYAVFSADQWVGYDDLKSVKAKIHLALSNNLGGLNYATIDRDDFLGQCGSSRFPLIKIGYDAVVRRDIPANPLEPTTTTEPTTTNEPTTTTEPITMTEPTPTTSPTSTTPPDELTNPSSSTSTTTKDPDSETRPTTTPTPTTTTKVSTTSRTTTTRMSTSSIPTPQVTPNGKETTNNGNADGNTLPSVTEPITTQRTTVIPTTRVTIDFRTPPATPGGTSQRTNDQAAAAATTTTTKKTTAYTIPTPPVTPGSRSKRFADIVSDKLATFKCPEKDGKFKNPNDCSSYILCADFVPYLFYCNSEFIFDDTSKFCDHKTNLSC